MRLFFTCIVALLFSSGLLGASFLVEEGGLYETPNELYQASVVSQGDTIFISARDYIGTEALAVWQSDDLVIIGIDGRPHLIADGQNIWGKGIWVLAGDNITVENIEFSGATVPDKNGAGIRLDGTGMAIRSCYFHNNENGILTSNPGTGDILIEYSEFAPNGFGDGFSHNLYIGSINRLTFRYNYSHHARVGHNLKSRAKENIITFNRIMDEDTGNSSRLIDLSNGGETLIMGNLLMQGPNAPNSNLIGYGLEGLSANATHELHVVNNTFINKRAASGLFLHVQPGTAIVRVQNNIFGGDGSLINGTTTIENYNLIESDIADIELMDEVDFDYHLLVGSPAIDAGIDLQSVEVLGYSLNPLEQYNHPMENVSRSTSNGTIDIGAYEYEVVSAAEILLEESGISVYPNPTPQDLFVKVNSGTYALKIYDVMGTQVHSGILSYDLQLDISMYQVGTYYLELMNTENNKIWLYSILKF